MDYRSVVRHASDHAGQRPPSAEGENTQRHDRGNQRDPTYQMYGMWLLVYALVPMLSVWLPFLHSRELLYQGYF